jgi:non-heme chloroperoxidase
MEVFDGIRAGVLADRAQYYKDLAVPFFGINRPGAQVSEGLRDSFWLQCLMGGLKNEYDCIKAFSETDFTEDLKRFDVPTLIIHGDDDQIVPFPNSAPKTARLVPHAKLVVFEGEGHGICSTRKDRVNQELLGFFRGLGAGRKEQALAGSGAA